MHAHRKKERERERERERDGMGLQEAIMCVHGGFLLISVGKCTLIVYV